LRELERDEEGGSPLARSNRSVEEVTSSEFNRPERAHSFASSSLRSDSGMDFHDADNSVLYAEKKRLATTVRLNTINLQVRIMSLSLVQCPMSNVQLGDFGFDRFYVFDFDW
jgi:hypothetical protein